ncbi:MAG: hypothetical protein NTY03_04455, partial [Candidatus Bathyarchaeota archaeon]|nr:hypothetical protein [Candidatus Bathyarchaeota archaeon]
MANGLIRCFVTGTSHCPKNPEAQANKVFVAMPFRKAYDDLYKYDDLYNIIEDELQNLGYETYKGDLDFSNSSITCKVCQNIQESRYILCEVSDWNPNVLWELGLGFNLALYVEDNGNTKTKYDITVQKIADINDKERIKFKMPYHDTPNAKTPVGAFNLKARLKNHSGKIGIHWILKSNVWKRFNILLPPLGFEETHDFEATMFEKSLFTQDETRDFYDFAFDYPTENAIVRIS